MTISCRCLPKLRSLLLLMMTAAFGALSTFAQKDLQIIVNGPWSYVAQNDALLLVAPGNSEHGVYIYEGVDPSRWVPVNNPAPGAPVPRAKGSYSITFAQNSYQPGDPPPNASLASTAVCAATVRNTTSVTSNSASANYVISLPMPDAFSTYEDPMFVWDGYSESKVSNQPVTSATPATLYTTIMVLHYWVQTVPSKLKLNSSDISTSGPKDPNPVGITIVAGSPDKDVSYRKCDDISLDSIHERNSLWRIRQYALFPEEEDDLGHQSHHYRYADCSPLSSDQTSVMNMQRRLESCKERGGVVKDHLCIFSGGSADCHACQMSINGAVQ